MQTDLARMSHKVEEIFDVAISKTTDAERDAYLDGACGRDVDLRQRVESLLKAHIAAGSFLLTPTENKGPIEGPGETIGNFKVLQKIGEGGFGTVYLAEQQYPIRRKVALKIIKLGMDTKQVIARFEAERQALALMDHTNIAKVFDAGATTSGRPYFIMELVRGIPITKYCDRNKVSTGNRLKLFMDICRAVQHAHNRGIIHRDLKPTNVLVTVHDGQPVPKIIDFGISKATNQRLTEKTLFTEYQQLIGTPQYMSPEQAEMGGLDIDTRSDIYSLGALLYELLTGTPPFETKTIQEAGYVEMQRIIRDVEPDKPSTRAATLIQQDTEIAKDHGADPQNFARSLRGDLDWIVAKAMEKDRTRRYNTANEFVTDIERYLSNEPVSAGPPSMVYKFGKFVRRNRLKVAASALVVTALFIGSVLATAGFVAASRDRDAARIAEQKAYQAAERSQAMADFLQDVLTASDPQQAMGLDVDARAVLAKAREVFGADHATVATTLASLALQLHSAGNYDQAEPLFRQSIEIWDTQFSKDHVNKGVVLSRLGTLLRLKGDEVGAENAFQESLRILRMQPGDDGIVVADTLMGLAEVFQNQGKYEDAETTIRQSLAIRQREAPHQHLQIALTINFLANLLIITDQTVKTTELMDECVDAFRVALPERSNAIAKVTMQAGAYYLSIKEPDKAEGYLNETLSIYKQNEFPSAMNRDITVRLLSRLVDLQDNGSDEFVPKRMEFLKTVREVVGEEHPKMGEFLAKGSAYCVEHRRFPKAISLAIESLDKLQAAYGGEESTKQALVALSEATRKIALEKTRTRQDYQLALQGTNRYLEIQSNDFQIVGTKGILQYRLQEFENALEMLQQSDQRHVEDFKYGAAEDIAFLAMTNCRLGNEEQAEQALDRLQNLKHRDGFSITEQYTRLLEEATAVLGSKVNNSPVNSPVDNSSSDSG